MEVPKTTKDSRRLSSEKLKVWVEPGSDYSIAEDLRIGNITINQTIRTTEIKIMFENPI